ncbi:two-component system nitrogen regulation response regulator GlnG [Methylohalomonas lacus]|uniref:DNA-binding transcriptional regulator NtrC n=1 Tax=Methylohalomonas lacus TaxID=398773 RepID=A0AAE3HMU1_9GAMM|nr:nitrogen regulation protein NR(I) [Methylohalomonas lacus]MCS3903407.1 two-component system nitrogen regulation response regulator GlnG [Methylohalomonas lacus]
MSESKTIWIVDDDRSIRWVLEKALAKESLETRSFDNPREVLSALERERPDLIISDIRMPEGDGVKMMETVKERAPEVPVIIMTAYSDLDRAVSAFRGGAFEYLSKPFDVDEVLSLVNRAVRQQEIPATSADMDSSAIDPEIIGSAPAMQEVFRAIGRLSRSNLTVLITGESGTGKELVARALHRHSPRADSRFIALNTAAIPRELLESELFGHEKGAFTGATAQRIGRFEQAHGGTLFLDEIGDMPAELQTRLLRVLADGEFYRVGGHTPIRVDVRVIAATHQNLEQRVKEGSFREDLLHRLNVIRVHVPSLRERRPDVTVLAEHFLKSAARELDVEPKQLLPETADFLNKLDWPGNVRQLENFCRWVTVMASGQQIHIDDLPPELRENTAVSSSSADWESMLRAWAESTLQNGNDHLLDDAVPRFERIMIETALKMTGGRRQDAARLLGWGRNTLTRKIKELDMEL